MNWIWCGRKRSPDMLRYYPDICPEEQKQTTKFLSQDRLSTELRVENWSPDYEAELLSIRLMFSVTHCTFMKVPTTAYFLDKGRAIAQAVSSRLPTAAARVQTRVWSCGRFCDGQKWRWGRFSPRTSVSPADLHSICFYTIIFTITRGWHNRPVVAAVPITSQTRI
jgi:hypothetical protein